MKKGIEYEIDVVRRRIFNSTSQLYSYTLTHNPEVLDAFLLRSPYKTGNATRTPSGTLFSSARRALSVTSSRTPQEITHMQTFEPVRLCDNDLVKYRENNVESEQKWRGKAEFTARIREAVRDYFYQVEYNKQIQRCVDECKVRAHDEHEQRSRLCAELRDEARVFSEENGRMDLDSEKLLVRIDSAFRSNAYLRLRVDSERKQLRRLNEYSSTEFASETALQYVHDNFAYLRAEDIIANIRQLEDNVLKAYTRECETYDDMAYTLSQSATQAAHAYMLQRRQEELSAHAKAKLTIQASKLRDEYTRLEEDAYYAQRAQTLLGTLSSAVFAFFRAWSTSLLALVDPRKLDQLRRQPYYYALFEPPEDPLTALQTLSAIADYVLGQEESHGGTIKGGGALYRRVALYCEQIYNTLYPGETELCKDVPAIVQRVCTGAVDGELAKKKKMQDIQVLEQDIVKLVQARDDIEKWQFYVVEQLEYLIKRREMHID